MLKIYPFIRLIMPVILIIDREALRPLIQTWDAFWVRSVDFYFGEEKGEAVVKLENGEESRSYLVYRATNIKQSDFSETPTDQVDSYKNSFVCEKDLE